MIKYEWGPWREHKPGSGPPTDVPEGTWTDAEGVYAGIRHPDASYEYLKTSRAQRPLFYDWKGWYSLRVPILRYRFRQIKLESSEKVEETVDA